MAITTQISESNGAGESVTDGITTSHYGTSDSANIAAATTEPIPVGENSYEKWQRLKWSSGTGVRVQNIRVYQSAGTTPANTTYLTSADSGTPSNPSYATPTRSASSYAVNAWPSSDPGVATISGTLTASGQYSGYHVHQVQVGASAVEGNTSGEITYVWEEVA